MSCFTASAIPTKGCLLVVDELLDYLAHARRARIDPGPWASCASWAKSSRLTPLRLLAGVQETLFDNPRFGFVADQLRRVRDRFEQVRIAREDIAYVVAERLLRKDDDATGPHHRAPATVRQALPASGRTPGRVRPPLPHPPRVYRDLRTGLHRRRSAR